MNGSIQIGEKLVHDAVLTMKSRRHTFSNRQYTRRLSCQ